MNILHNFLNFQSIALNFDKILPYFNWHFFKKLGRSAPYLNGASQQMPCWNTRAVLLTSYARQLPLFPADIKHILIRFAFINNQEKKMRADNIYLFYSLNINKFKKETASVFLKIASCSANRDNWTKCDKPALRDGTKCWLLQPYFSLAIQRQIGFIVTESMNLQIWA